MKKTKAGGQPLRVLVVEDSEFDARMLIGLLRAGGFDPDSRRVDTEEEMKEVLRDGPWDIVLADYNMPEFSAPEALCLIQEMGLDVPFIIVSGGIGEDTAVAAMKAGAHDYLMKGNLARLVPAVERELREAKVRLARNRAEQELRESEQRHRSLIENVSDIIGVLDRRGRVTYVSPSSERVLGLLPGAIVGRNVFRFVHREDVPRIREVFSRELKSSDGVFSFEARIRDSLGHWRIMETTVNNLLDDGGIDGLVFNTRDITERLKVQEALSESEEQFRVAREIQQHLFPAEPPTVEGFDIAGATRPADVTGGDYFDYLPTLHDRWGLVVGDVTGHGVGPAMLMAETRAYLRILARNREDPGVILTRANRMLAADLGNERFVTVLFTKLDPEKGALTYSSAGHVPGCVLNKSGEVKLLLKRSGMPLGMMPETRYETSSSIPLEPDDLVLLLTDGLEEAAAPDGSLLGRDRILEVVRASFDKPAKEIVREVLDSVGQFSQDTPQADDLTMIVVKVE